MAPDPQQTYLHRVVMEIIETERMYVRDLRMIVEVSDSQSQLVPRNDHIRSILAIVTDSTDPSISDQ